MKEIYALVLDDCNSGFQSENLSFPSADLNFFIGLNDQIRGFSHDFSNVKIPIRIYNTLLELLKRYSLEPHKEQFVTLICASKYIYDLYAENPEESEELLPNLEQSKKEMAKLLSLLETCVFEDITNINALKFKSKEGKTVAFKNFFVIQDIINTLIGYYRLTPENFDSRKEEILQGWSTLEFSKGANYIKSNIIKSIVDSLDENLSENERLRISGLLLHLAQIRSNKIESCLLYNDLETNLMIIEVNNLRHYYKPRTSFFT